jgi:hypothetical protein
MGLFMLDQARHLLAVLQQLVLQVNLQEKGRSVRWPGENWDLQKDDSSLKAVFV